MNSQLIEASDSESDASIVDFDSDREEVISEDEIQNQTIVEQEQVQPTIQVPQDVIVVDGELSQNIPQQKIRTNDHFEISPIIFKKKPHRDCDMTVAKEIIQTFGGFIIKSVRTQYRNLKQVQKQNKQEILKGVRTFMSQF